MQREGKMETQVVEEAWFLYEPGSNYLVSELTRKDGPWKRFAAIASVRIVFQPGKPPSLHSHVVPLACVTCGGAKF